MHNTSEEYVAMLQQCPAQYDIEMRTVWLVNHAPLVIQLFLKHNFINRPTLPKGH